jgi:hypothetical protein
MGTAQAKARVEQPVDLFDKCFRLPPRGRRSPKAFTRTSSRSRSRATPKSSFGGSERSPSARTTISGSRITPTSWSGHRQALHHYGTGCTGSRLTERHARPARGARGATRAAYGPGERAGVQYWIPDEPRHHRVAGRAKRGRAPGRLNHASLVDAAQLSGGQMVRYPHGDLTCSGSFWSGTGAPRAGC